MTTTIAEVADRIFRIHTPVPSSVEPEGFSYNQYLVLDEEPLLFHTGSRLLFGDVSQAIERVVPLVRLKLIAFAHWETDECGALDAFLERSPHAVPVCSRVNALINRDGMSRPPRVMADGEVILLGTRRVRWFETPHLPHGWESGLLLEETTGTLFCSDIFAQLGTGDEPLVEADILSPSEALRARHDFYAHGPEEGVQIERLADAAPRVLACMHGHAWTGDGRALLRELAARLSG